MNIAVTVTPDFRIITDERNYIVKERYFTDPTKAPGYKAVEGTPSPPLRETWDHPQHQHYYSLTAAGLSTAISFIIGRTCGRDAATLAELLAEYNAESTRLRALVEQALTGTEVAANGSGKETTEDYEGPQETG